MERPVRSMHMNIVERRALGGNVYRVTIAANEKVRQPPELDFRGLSTKNYLRNPVVMWAHDSVGRSPSGGLPIGRTLSLTTTPGGRVVAEFEFLSDDPFAQRVKNAWDKGFLQAASVSWLPLETAPAPSGGWRDTRADLLEWSIVSVPADPDTLKESHRRMIDAFLQGHEATAGWSVGLDKDLGADRERWPQAPVVHVRDGADDTASKGSLALSPDDYDDLTTALALLRDVVDGVHHSGRAWNSKKTAQQSPEAEWDSDLAEIRELVGAIRGAVRLK